MAQNWALQSMRRAFYYNVRQSNLAAVKQLKAKFDPFHPCVGSLRDFVFAMTTPTVRKTNINCVVKMDVKSDRSIPLLEVDFADGHRALFKTENLNPLEITVNFNKLCEEHPLQQATKKR